MKKYESLKKQYPEYVSLNQLYKICNIAKRSALYLVKNNIIPCIENDDNKTWRYKIPIDAVIAYLVYREQVGSMIPKGMIKNGCKNKKRSLPKSKDIGTKEELTVYFNYRFTDYPDILTTAKAAKMAGICRASVLKFIKDKKLNFINNCNTYMIPKSWLIEFMSSPGLY